MRDYFGKNNRCDIRLPWFLPAEGRIVHGLFTRAGLNQNRV